jgi:hypothetical protein
VSKSQSLGIGPSNNEALFNFEPQRATRFIRFIKHDDDDGVVHRGVTSTRLDDTLPGYASPGIQHGIACRVLTHRDDVASSSSSASTWRLGRRTLECESDAADDTPTTTTHRDDNVRDV